VFSNSTYEASFVLIDLWRDRVLVGARKKAEGVVQSGQFRETSGLPGCGQTLLRPEKVYHQAQLTTKMTYCVERVCQFLCISFRMAVILRLWLTLPKKSTRLRNETALHVVLKFQFVHACFQREASKRNRKCRCQRRQEYLLDVCMVMGIPTGMGFPWEFCGNGNSFRATNGIGSGYGNDVMGMGMAHL